ncbi:hypothetical protein [Candidatus Palauibacter sp.]|uniref:hypothetical protein n=1 Tax=Candidatus Palauibacter sp. TaxID=3101350 RepID=UPI003C6EB634
MNASHASLRHDFGVSTAALDEIVRVALDAGAAGARDSAAAPSRSAGRAGQRACWANASTRPEEESWTVPCSWPQRPAEPR